ncbi:MAG: hypothetical protein AAFU77_14055 [Myxococcota bacterium]
MDDEPGVETRDAAQTQSLTTWDSGRGPAFLELVRKLNLDNKDGGPTQTSMSAVFGDHTCTGQLSGYDPHAASYRVLCTRAGRDQDKRGLLFVFYGTQTQDEFCDQALSSKQSNVETPWGLRNVETLANWAHRVEELAPFVTSEISAYRIASGTSITNPVIFAGHSKGGVVAQIYGMARSAYDAGNDSGSFDGAYHDRYTTVISFNSPKPTYSIPLADSYKDWAENVGHRYKTVWIERAYDAVQVLPPSWPDSSTYQNSRYRTAGAPGQRNHLYRRYTTSEMEDAAYQLQLDPWGGHPRQGYFGVPNGATSCPANPF